MKEVKLRMKEMEKYKKKGKSGFVHGNRSKKPAKTLDKHFSDDIILLYRNKYQGFNFKHFYEYLIEEEIEVIVNHEIALEDSHPRGEKPKYY